MIKLIFCVRKGVDISTEEFRTIWNTDYRNKLLEFAKIAKVKSLDFNLTLLIEANTNFMLERGTAPPYDGFIEFYWNNANELQVTMQDKSVQASLAQLRALSDSFIDISHSRMFFVECNPSIKINSKTNECQ